MASLTVISAQREPCIGVCESLSAWRAIDGGKERFWGDQHRAKMIGLVLLVVKLMKKLLMLAMMMMTRICLKMNKEKTIEGIGEEKKEADTVAEEYDYRHGWC